MRLFFCLLLLCLFFGLSLRLGAQEKPLPPPGPQIQQIGPRNTIVVEAIGEPGHYTGFDVRADGKLVAPVRFTSRELIFSDKAVVATRGTASTLTFPDLQAAPDCGLALTQSRIVVTLAQQQFPTVAFDLNLASFSPRDWQQNIGMQPFHFLTIGLPEATAWHQRGWLTATPHADLFPLLLDVHANTPELSAFPYNREWSLTPPLSAHPLPVIGLWSPARKLYAGWDFLAARLTDGSERDIATGFCNRLIVPVDLHARQPIEETQPPTLPLPDLDAPRSRDGLPPHKRDPRMRHPLTYDQQASRELDRAGASKFVALVYPQGGKDYQQLVYPKSQTRIASHATLMFHADLSDSDDPNRFLWQEWWSSPTLRSRLQHANSNVSTSMPPVVTNHPLLFHDAAQHDASLIRTADEERMYIPGSLLLNGQQQWSESNVEAIVHSGDAVRVKTLQNDVQTLLRYAHRFTIDKEPCVYWEQPLAGEWTGEWGAEPATTLHNTQGWAAGRLLLDAYRIAAQKRRSEEEKKKNNQQETSVAVDAGNMPEKQSTSSFLPFSSSSLLRLVDGVFNWTKHIVWTRGTYADSPASATAEDSVLAIRFLLDYYFTFKEDILDTEHRTRALQALELARAFAYRSMILWTGHGHIHSNPDNAFLWEAGAGRDYMGAISVHSLEGTLDTLAQVAVHTGDPILMWAVQGSLLRTLPTSTNVRHSTGKKANMRVICGEKAAIAFPTNVSEVDSTQKIAIHNYRCSAPGDFAFTLRLPGQYSLSKTKASVSIAITFPYVDLSQRPVALRHGNITQQTLTEGSNLRRESDNYWSLYIDGLLDGDMVIIGKPNLSVASSLPTVP